MTTFRGGRPWEEGRKRRRQLFTHGEKAGMMLCMAMMLFSLSQGDIPLLFFSSAFIIYEVQHALEQIDRQRFHACCSFLWGLCLTMFIGAIIMVIF